MTTENNVNDSVDDSVAYDDVQRDKPIDDPLAAIKTMRLEQLAVCRLKAEKEMQSMADKAKKSKG